MRKKLVRHGNSKAIILDRTMLDLLGIGDDGECIVRIEGDALIITSAKEQARERAFDHAVRESMEKYSDAYRRLAE